HQDDLVLVLAADGRGDGGTPRLRVQVAGEGGLEEGVGGVAGGGLVERPEVTGVHVEPGGGEGAGRGVEARLVDDLPDGELEARGRDGVDHARQRRGVEVREQAGAVGAHRLPGVRGGRGGDDVEHVVRVRRLDRLPDVRAEGDDDVPGVVARQVGGDDAEADLAGADLVVVDAQGRIGDAHVLVRPGAEEPKLDARGRGGRPHGG